MSETNPLMQPPREKVLVLYPGDVETRIEELEEQMDAAVAEEHTAPRGPVRPHGGKPKNTRADDIAEQLDAVRAEAEERVLRIRLRQVSSRAFDLLLDEHPPRKAKALDEKVGYDRDKFPVALIRASLVEPDVSDDQFAEWIASASAGRLERIFSAAYDVTTGEVEIPKFSAVSALTQVRRQP